MFHVVYSPSTKSRLSIHGILTTLALAPLDLAVQICAIRGGRLEHATGRMAGVSEGGLCFIGVRYLSPGTGVNIEFDDSRLVGEVKHCRLRESAARVQFVTGVQIQQALDVPDSWKCLTQGPARTVR